MSTFQKKPKQTSSLLRAAARCPAGSPSLFLPYYWLHQPIPFYLLMFALTLRTLFSLSCCSLINAAAPVVSDSHKGVKGETTLTSLPSARPRTFLMKEAWDKCRPWLIRQCLFISLFVCLFVWKWICGHCVQHWCQCENSEGETNVSFTKTLQSNTSTVWLLMCVVVVFLLALGLKKMFFFFVVVLKQTVVCYFHKPFLGYHKANKDTYSTLWTVVTDKKCRLGKLFTEKNSSET